jgi:hypothetical protein
MRNEERAPERARSLHSDGIRTTHPCGIDGSGLPLSPGDPEGAATWMTFVGTMSTPMTSTPMR